MAIRIRPASLGGSASVPNATTTTSGKVRLATSAETTTGTDATIAVTPAGLQSALSGVVGGLTYIEPWSAITATPDLSNAKKGYFYLVSGAGERYGIDWQVGDHLVINEDMGGTIDPNKIDKIDNTESIANLGDLLDVTLASEASGQVLRYSGTEWVNAQLSASDVSGVAADSDLTALEARVTTNEGDISTIDGRVTANEGDISNLQTEVNAIEAGAGLSSTGSYSPDLTADYISTASSLKNADSLLDDQIKINADAISASATNISNLQTEVNAIEAGAGLSSTGAYSPDLTADYISTASSLKNADSLLDDQIKINADAIAALGASSVESVNGVAPVGGDVTLGGADIDSAHSATNYTAASADLDTHLGGVDTALGLKVDSSSLASVATSGAYSDLSGAPALASVATSGAYSDLSGTPTLGTAAALDVGTSANNVVQLNGSAQLPALDGSNLTGVTSDLSGASIDDLGDVTITTATSGDGLVYNGTAWVNSALADVATSGAYADLSGTPTLATVATSGAYSDLSGTPTLGTAAALDVGTSANNVVQLNGSGALPAVDGSNLTGVVSDISGASVGDLSDVTITSAANGDALVYNGTAWVDQALASVATSGAYADLSGTPTLGTASAEDVGTTIGDVVQLEDVGGSPGLPAVDGSQLTGLAVELNDLNDVTITAAVDGDALVYNGTAWVDQALATVATSGAYADLSGAPALASVATSGEYADLLNKPTLGTAAALDVGTAANNVVQLNGSGALPAVDGSNLTGITADVTTASIGDLSDVTITAAANGDALVYNGTAWVDQALATVATSGAYADLSGTPTLATVATSGAYADLSGTPTLSTVATSGDYSDLLNKPTLGTAAALNVGTAANNVVQLNGSGALPAIDGSNLTGITADVTTASLGDLANVTITSAANGDALVYNGTAWVDQALASVATSGAYADLSGTPTLATVATSGDYADLNNAPQSMIGTAEFITTAAALDLEAGKHYIIGTAISTTKTLTLPAVTNAGEYIRITNWGDGELVIQVDQTDTDAYLLVGNSVVQGGSVTVESRATIDCFGFNYSAGGLDPAWGVYFSSSIELNTRSFSTSGQLPVYDATAGELAAGDLGDLTFSFSPVNYDNTRGGTVTGNAVGDHFGGVDDELGVLDGNITTLDGVAVKSINTLTPTAGAVTLGGANIDTAHTAVDYTAAAADLDSHLAGIDTRLGEKANKADGLNGLADVDLTTPATDGQILLFDGVSSTFKPGPPPAPIADTTTLGLVELATDAEAQAATATDRAIVPSNLAALDLDTFADVAYPSAPTDNQVLQWVNTNSRWEPKTFSPPAPNVTSASPGSTYAITTHEGIEEIYLLTPSVNCTVSIPTASASGSGYKYNIKNLSANEITINDTIDGVSGLVLGFQNASATIVSDGTSWYVI